MYLNYDDLGENDAKWFRIEFQDKLIIASYAVERGLAAAFDKWIN